MGHPACVSCTLSSEACVLIGKPIKERGLRMSKGYIEVISDYTIWNIKLTLWDRLCIGKFTRENVARWLEKYANKRLDPGWWAKDFHAVLGDIDIPWATKEGFDCYQ